MKYRTMGKLDWEVSALGFGAMRLPVINEGEEPKVNEEETIKIIRYAIDHGVNYVDTAWPYHNGQSEIVVGKALQNGYREKVKLVSKLPIWAVEKTEDFDEFLAKQLEKLQTDHLDIYLFHGLSKDRWEKIKKLNLIKKMEQAKIEGKIKHFGFSFHDSLNQFKEIIDGYQWEACQIQYNYLDTEYQAGTEGLKYAASKGVAVIIMEPLRGGSLVGEDEKIVKLLEKAPVNRKLADWGLQFVWNHPEVSVVLSGMGNMQMVEENIASAENSGINHLRSEETDFIKQLKELFQEKITVPCTMCRYCQPCPSGVAIPDNLQLLNRIMWGGIHPFNIDMYKGMADTPEALEQKPNSGRATLCIECGECLEKCPQSIDIPENLKKVAEKYEPLIKETN